MCEAIDCGDSFGALTAQGVAGNVKFVNQHGAIKGTQMAGQWTRALRFRPWMLRQWGRRGCRTSMARCVWPRFHQPLLESMLKQVSVLSKSRCPPASIRRFKRARAW